MLILFQIGLMVATIAIYHRDDQDVAFWFAIVWWFIFTLAYAWLVDQHKVLKKDFDRRKKKR